ncbi:DUF6653 family protein [Pelobacter seleniigenes]
MAGVILTDLEKSWFLDRKVWLYEDIKEANARYKGWDY